MIALRRGVAALPATLRQACRESVLAHQEDDGGFHGRAGPADDWYTDFAVRILALTGGAEGALRRASAWLAQRQSPPDLAAAHARVNAAFTLAQLGLPTRLDRVAIGGALAAQTVTGGYAQPGGRTASLCQLFLADRTFDLLGRELPDRRHLIVAAAAWQGIDGGFADSAGGDSLATATAAAVTLLARHRALDPIVAERAAMYGVSLQGGDGGVRVHAGLVQGDLLATCTLVWALSSCGHLGSLRLGDLARFVQACRHGGGFGACPGDVGSDPEYVFYGLGTLGLLAAQADQGAAAPRVFPGLRGLLLAWPPTRRMGWRLLGTTA
jgi:hypothetical protein